MDASDLFALLSAWGDCPPKGDCAGDLDGNGDVGAVDLLLMLGQWS